jgi:hypothetical protein
VRARPTWFILAAVAVIAGTAIVLGSNGDGAGAVFFVVALAVVAWLRWGPRLTLGISFAAWMRRRRMPVRLFIAAVLISAPLPLLSLLRGATPLYSLLFFLGQLVVWEGVLLYANRKRLREDPAGY